MRMVFGVLSLLLVVLVIGFLTKKQLGTISSVGVNSPASAGISEQSATLSQHSQLLQNQVKKSLEDAMQQVSPQLDEK